MPNANGSFVKIHANGVCTASWAGDNTLPALAFLFVLCATPIYRVFRFVLRNPGYIEYFIRCCLSTHKIAHGESCQTFSIQPRFGLLTTHQFSYADDICHPLGLLQGKQAQWEACPRCHAGIFAAQTVKKAVEYKDTQIGLSLTAASGKIDDVHYLSFFHHVWNIGLSKSGNPGDLAYDKDNLEQSPFVFAFSWRWVVTCTSKGFVG